VDWDKKRVRVTTEGNEKMNQDERRAKQIVAEELKNLKREIPDFDKLFQNFVNSDFRKGLGNQKPYALSVAFSMWLGSCER
jgi:hypothetical protein